MYVSLLAAIALWAVLLARMWWQPIVADDELVYMSAVTWPNSPMRVNPPLYMYSVRLCFAVFGQSVSSARLPGVLAGMFTLALIPSVIVRVLDKSEQTYWTAALATWMYALSPNAVQNMMFIDIDTAFLTAALLALVWLWLTIEPCPPWQRIVLLGFGFALTLWVKLLSPVLTMSAISLYYLLQRQPKRFVEMLGTTSFGGLVFWLTFRTNLTSQYAFGYTGSFFSRLNILNPENVQFIATVFPQGAGVVMLWLSIPIVIVLVTALFYSIRRWWQRQANVLDALILYGAGGTLAYTIVIFPAWGYPRYQAPFMVILSLVAAITIAQSLFRIIRPGWKILVAVAAIGFAFHTLFIGDPMLRLYLVTFETTTGQLAARLKQGLLDAARVAALIPIMLIISYWAAKRLRISRSSMLIAATGALAISSLAATTWAQVNARYSTRYRYGYGLDDMLQAARRARDHAGPAGYVAAIDDVLFYTGLRGAGIYGLATRSLMGETSISLLDLMHQRQIDAMVWTTKDAVRSSDVVQSPEIEQILQKCYTQEIYGVFLVYLRRPHGDCP